MRRSERHEHERSDSAARAKLLLMARKEFHAFFRWRVVRVRSFCEAKAIRSRASRLCGGAPYRVRFSLSPSLKSSIVIPIAVHLPPLQPLSDTLHAATAAITSVSALSTILSPAFDYAVRLRNIFKRARKRLTLPCRVLYFVRMISGVICLKNLRKTKDR